MIYKRTIIDKNLGVLLCAIPLYFTQGGLFPRGSIVSQILVLLWLLLILYCIVKTITSRRLVRYEKSILFFCILATISFLLSPKSLDAGWEVFQTYGELKNIFLMLLSYFPFKYGVERNLLDTKYLAKFATITICAYVFGYFVSLYEALFTEFWKDSVTNNGGYLMPLVIPLLGLFFKKKKTIIMLAVGMVLVLFSSKRGAILCYVFEAFIYAWYALFSESSKKISPKRILTVIFGIIIIAYAGYRTVAGNDYLQDRLYATQSGDSSGRDQIYKDAAVAFQNGSLIQSLCGYGFFQNIEVNGAYAHSDWYELMVDMGVIGLIAYFSIFFLLSIWFFKNKKRLSLPYRFMFVSAVGCWFLKSLFSMGFNSPEASMLSIAIAISMSSVLLDNKCNENQSIGRLCPKS